MPAEAVNGGEGGDALTQTYAECQVLVVMLRSDVDVARRERDSLYRHLMNERAARQAATESAEISMAEVVRERDEARQQADELAAELDVVTAGRDLAINRAERLETELRALQDKGRGMKLGDKITDIKGDPIEKDWAPTAMTVVVNPPQETEVRQLLRSRTVIQAGSVSYTREEYK